MENIVDCASAVSQVERESRSEIIDYALGIVCDLVPYSDPDYSTKVMELAESYADAYFDDFKAEWDSCVRNCDEKVVVIGDDLPF